jgi:hypothetical protein
MGPPMLSIVVILATAVLCFAMFLVVQSFGNLQRIIASDNARTRSSCEENAQRVIRTERRIADDELAAIEQVRVIMKEYHDQRSA